MTSGQDNISTREIIGVIPAAGQALRIGPLPCSKELFPIGFHSADQPTVARPKAVIEYLLEKLCLAGIPKAYIIVRPGKWDIPAYLGDGKALGLDLAYLMLGLPYGVPYTLDQAYPFVEHAIVALGFPDILFKPADAYAQLLRCLAADDSDVILGIFPADQPQKMDVIELAPGNCVRRVIVKPDQTDLRYTWGIAVWMPTFTRFMHEYLSRLTVPPPSELHLGHVLQEAIAAGLRIGAVRVSDDPFLDIGTPDNLVTAVRRFSLT